MARYALMYEESQRQLRKAQAALSKSEHNRERYRQFINDAGHIRAYLIWVARKDGFDEESIKLIEQLAPDVRSKEHDDVPQNDGPPHR